MKQEYVLGVDGGNTKTQYFLYDGDGNFVDGIEAGTCSHEALSDSFAGTRLLLGTRRHFLFPRNGSEQGTLPAPYSAWRGQISDTKKSVFLILFPNSVFVTLSWKTTVFSG